MENIEIARALERLGDLLEIQGANPFRVRAYRNAARVIEGYARPLKRLVAQGEDLTGISGVGKDMAEHIHELVNTGRLTPLEETEREVPESLLEVMGLPQVGAKRTKKLWDELGVESLADLKTAAEEGKVAELAGFGKKTQDKILEAVQEHQQHAQRFLLSEADEYVAALLDHMNRVEGFDRIEVAGSYRRRKETIGDLDLLVTADEAKPIIEHFTGWDSVKEVVSAGETRSTVMLSSGLQVDLRVLEPDNFGAALAYFTGSKAHSIRIRQRGLDRGYHISEYGVFRSDGEGEGKKTKGSTHERVAGSTEEEVYACVELPWITPELREDRGEIETAEEDALPELVTTDDLRGDLQMHTDWSDGRDSLEDMVAECARRGYEYVAITDHSSSLGMGGRLDLDELKRQHDALKKAAGKHGGLEVLRGMEVDIRKDGSLDVDEKVLELLDVVLISVHSSMELSEKQQTQRVLSALEHPRVSILAHPTCRRINERPPLRIDLDDVLSCAKENGVLVEINAQPRRLDLNDAQAMRAKELGAQLIINSDAHSVQALQRVTYGVDQARRAWLSKGDIVNTFSRRDFMRLVKKP